MLSASHSQEGAELGGVRTLTDPRLSLPSLSKQTNWPLRDGPTCGQTEGGLKNTNTVRHCGVDSRRACLTTVTVISFLLTNLFRIPINQ